jgi:threonine dehydratase
MDETKKFIEEIDILKAKDVIGNQLHKTPLIHSSYLNKLLGIDLYLKCELFQKTGSFKPRGVLNKLHSIKPENMKRGVVSISAGNYAQALAWGSSLYGVKSTIVMPASAVTSKIEATRNYGGEVILTNENLLDTCLSIQQERELIMMHPFDDLHLIAGHGTAGFEIIEDLSDVDTILVSIGGGGLISGIATAAKIRNPNIKIIGVEPVGAAAMSKSLEKNEPVTLDQTDTIADGLAAPFAGAHTLAHVQKYVDEVVLVEDEDIKQAMKLILERCKILAEPAAAASLAAILSNKVKLMSESKVVCVLSGGNIDNERLKLYL